MFCNSCRHEFPSNANFCSSCGSKLAPKSNAPSSSAPASSKSAAPSNTYKSNGSSYGSSSSGGSSYGSKPATSGSAYNSYRPSSPSGGGSSSAYGSSSYKPSSASSNNTGLSAGKFGATASSSSAAKPTQSSTVAPKQPPAPAPAPAVPTRSVSPAPAPAPPAPPAPAPVQVKQVTKAAPAPAPKPAAPAPKPAPAVTITKEESESSSDEEETSAPKGGNKWSEMMAKKKENEYNEERQKIRGRRRGGQQFVDNQIRYIIAQIKKLGRDGKYINFGDLFEATVDHCSALAAILNKAKARGVVDYKGDMLMQGTHNDVTITLLKDEIEDSAPIVTVCAPKNATQLPQEQTGPLQCNVCSKTVFPIEKVVANSKVMHKSCFRCVHCSNILKLSAYAFGNGQFYCETHFQQLFKANSGYNF